MEDDSKNNNNEGSNSASEAGQSFNTFLNTVMAAECFKCTQNKCFLLILRMTKSQEIQHIPTLP